MPTKEIIALIAVGIMVLAPLLVMGERIKSGRGLGARAIQFCSVVMIVPLILILALFDVLSKETSAALIGALTGYLLSGIGGYDPARRKGGAASSDNSDI